MIRKPASIIITLRIPRDLHSRVTALAAREERTIAAVIRLAVREYLDRKK